MLIPVLERVVLTAWAGALWSIGYVASPLLFRALEDTSLAAELSGVLTGAVAWISILCAVILVPAQLRYRVRPWAAHWRLWLVVGLTGMIVLGELVVRPPMEALMEQADDVAYLASLRVAESLYFIASAMALVLVIGGPRPLEAGESGPAARRSHGS